MSGYTLHARKEPVGPVDASPLRPDTLGAMEREEAAAVRLTVGSFRARVDDLFEIEGDPGPRLILHTPENAGRGFLHLAAGMASGSMEVLGDGGDLCGMRMSGGSLRIHGSVGRSAGAGMSGGLLRIDGDAGDLLGGPPPTDRRGMTGGEVVVLGSAGERAGHRMRRGTLAVAGTAGRHPGHAMIAGTVVVGTGPLLSPGTEMKRGTVVGLDRTADHDPAPGFEPDAKHRPVWMRLLLRRLAALGFPVPDGALGGLFQSWSGDRLSLGRGEVYRWLEV